MEKKIFFFSLAVCISLLAATYRWTDSAHSIGLIKASGGQARHASTFESGNDLYTLIATATVIPPYRGDARIVLEGSPEIDYRIHSSDPVIDLGIRRQPRLRDNVLYDLQPKDRIALWVVMKPPVLDPVCNMAYQKEFTKEHLDGKDYFFCSDGCRTAFKAEPGKYRGGESIRGNYTLAFYDTKTDKAVLRVPLIFKGKGELKDAGEHHH
ncbi:MAG: YHS domain-containing protein [Nitrospirae bacterium]|nr:YHS domain-containing protein [Nitrospirota bacterium]